MTYIIYNGTDTSSVTYKLWLTSISATPLPVRRYDYYDIAGKSGQMVIEKDEFEDARIDVGFCMKNNPNLTDAVLNSIFNGAGGTLVISDDLTVFYKVKAIEMPARYRQRNASRSVYDTLTMTFVCEPFRYAVADNPVTLTADGYITNIGTYKSLPKITIALTDTTADGSVDIGGHSINVYAGDTAVTIDCDLYEAYDENGLANDRISLDDFFALPVGQTAVTFGDNIASVTVERRTRFL